MHELICVMAYTWSSEENSVEPGPSFHGALVLMLTLRSEDLPGNVSLLAELIAAPNLIFKIAISDITKRYSTICINFKGCLESALLNTV